MNTERIMKMHGGEGHVIVRHLLDEKLRGKGCGLYAEVTLEKDCEIGYHTHTDESETYYILSGEGEYNDNGLVRNVSAGDVTFTPSNCGHALKNTGDGDLKLMALILKY